MKATYVDHMGSDLSVVNAARVSYSKHHTEFQDGKDDALIRFLARENHRSPFGHAFASFHVSAPIFVARQMVKHKFLRWNEVSRRYVSYPPTFYVPSEWRGRPQNSKQGSDGVVDSMKLEDSLWLFEKLYDDLLKDGVAPEQARMVLPQNMYTEWYWSGSLDAFADMCNLRCKPDTQQETSEIAIQIDEIMEGLFPHSWKALRS